MQETARTVERLKRLCELVQKVFATTKGISECLLEMIGMNKNHKLLVFFALEEKKSHNRTGETQVFTLESHACQSK